MNIDLKRIPHILFFIVLLPLLSLGISFVAHQIYPDPSFWLESLTPLGAYLLLFGLFEKYFWAWQFFRKTGIVTFPDLRGRWDGQGISRFKDDNGNPVEFHAVVEIKQSFSKIVVEGFFEQSESSSVIANFYIHNGTPYLYYNYDNDPNSFRRGTMQMHRGTIKLRVLEDESRLRGSYFNSIGNDGDFDFSFESKKLKGHF